MECIRILLVDDQASVRRGLAMRLRLEPDLRVVGEAADGESALAACEALQPDVLVMDYAMPGLDGIATLRRLVALGSRSRVVMLSVHDQAALRREAVQAGASAFIAKHEPGERLLAAIREAANSTNKEGQS